MGKIVKRILIVVLALIVLAVALLFGTCAVIDYKNKHYWKYASPYGSIEKQYTPLGAYEVSFDEYKTKNKTCKKFEIWYPSELKSAQKIYPLVIMVNGTGVMASQYKEVFKHLASWGFIVAGNEDENSRTGASSAATLDYILALNEDENNKFYGKIDRKNIGIAGHSQGGVGALNAVTEQKNGNKYKAIWAVSATSRYHADELNKSGDGWTCYPSKINIPVFMAAGTLLADAGNMTAYTQTLKDGEAQGICPKWWLDECYAAVPDTVAKVTARAKDKDHGDMLRFADGYMTAWFMYWLKGETGADFFGGAAAELSTNKNWQDVQSNR